MKMVGKITNQNQSLIGNEDASGTMSEEKAAEKIQASFRGYKTRKSLKDNGALPGKGDAIANNPIKEVEEKAKELVEHASAETAAKLNSAKQTLEDELADIDLTDKDLEKAATKIQASYRNFTAKKKQPEPNSNSSEKQAEPEKKEPIVNGKGENQDEENLDDIDLKDPQVEKAAVKIQSTFRGYKTRKAVNVDGKPLENGEKGDDED
ncbi:neuromodulin-like isoform X2 [Argiope bruennichi]|uniref:neuromodulin-like isoform X2 n=1 Tax=Argiope bruennichi TaxID=94029 RepID=UPI0024951117|nr:neuromodulin-like isoform X2 [Argiope bruennichi]